MGVNPASGQEREPVPRVHVRSTYAPRPATEVYCRRNPSLGWIGTGRCDVVAQHSHSSHVPWKSAPVGHDFLRQNFSGVMPARHKLRSNWGLETMGRKTIQATESFTDPSCTKPSGHVELPREELFR